MKVPVMARVEKVDMERVRAEAVAKGARVPECLGELVHLGLHALDKNRKWWDEQPVQETPLSEDPEMQVRTSVWWVVFAFFLFLVTAWVALYLGA